MSVDEFNQLSGDLVARAMNEGVLKDAMNVFEVVGVLEQRKAEVLRFSQQLFARKAAKEKPLILVPKPGPIN